MATDPKAQSLILELGDKLNLAHVYVKGTLTSSLRDVEISGPIDMGTNPLSAFALFVELRVFSQRCTRVAMGGTMSSTLLVSCQQKLLISTSLTCEPTVRKCSRAR